MSTLWYCTRSESKRHCYGSLTAGNVVIGICVKDRGGGSDDDAEVSTLDTEAGTEAVDVMFAVTGLVVHEDASEKLVDRSSDEVRGWEVAVAA